MKIELKKTENNYLKGWELIAETVEEKHILGSIRNAEFFGFELNHPEYDGYEDEVVNDDNGKEHRYVTKVKYKIPKYNK